MRTVEETRRLRLIALAAELGSQKMLADRLECSSSQIGQYTGEHRRIGDKFARKVEEKFGHAAGWMDQPIDVERLDSPDESDFAMIPQLDLSASCGHGCYEDHVVVKGGLAFKRSSLVAFGVPEASARVIHACGGSMEPTIQDGCVVLLNISDTEPREGRVYAIVQPDGGLVLKRLVRDYLPTLGGQGWVMRSDNTDKIKFPDKILPPDDRTVIVGRAVWNDNRL